MKKEIHPDYHPVLFVDDSAKFEFASRSTMTSKETRDINGVKHFVVKLEISSASHPFFTGKQLLIDTAGRVEKFRRKYGSETKGSEVKVARPKAEAKPVARPKAAPKAKVEPATETAAPKSKADAAPRTAAPKSKVDAAPRTAAPKPKADAAPRTAAP